MTRHSVFAASGVLGIAFALLGVAGIWYEGRNANAKFLTNNESVTSPCDFRILPKAEALEACLTTIGDRNLFVLIGDSHAAAMAQGLRENLEKRDADLVSLAMPGCFPIPGVGQLREYKNLECEKFSQSAYQVALRLNPKAIIMAARWTMQTGKGGYESVYGVREFIPPFRAMVTSTDVSHPAQPSTVEAHTIGFLLNLSTSAPLFIVGQIPEVGIDVTKLSVFAPEKLQYPIQSYIDRNISAHAALSELGNRRHSILFFNPGRVFCADGLLCVQTDSKGLFYSDDDHLSLHGSRVLAAAIVPELTTFVHRQ